MRRFILWTALTTLTVVASLAQDVDDDVVKITSKIVQVDVVVTDDKGRQVTDLSAADFQIFQDGKLKTISGFSYVPLGSAALPASSGVDRRPKGERVIIPQPTKRTANRGRVIAFIVDDGNCRASMSGMTAAREGLERFVTEQMQPDDLVAIYQTRSGSSMFQQYTSDRERLLRAARKIRWYPSGGGCAVNDGSFSDAARVNTEAIATSQGLKSITTETEAERARRELSEDQARDRQVVGSLGVLRYAIRGLDRIPGRKVLFLMSDGVPLMSRDRRILQAADGLRDITELANRSAVVINTIDARGLYDPSMIEARDDVSTIGSATATARVSEDRRREAFSTQDGLAFLAGETGGKFYKNENYLHAPVARALAIEKGYYLVAYEPDDDSFKGKNFNKIEVRITRPNLNVSSRSGYLGIPDQIATKPAKSGYSELYEAIVAPIASSGMDLRLTAYFGNTVAEGSFVRSMIHISGGDISFNDEPGGLKKAVVDVVAVTMNEKNEVIDEFTHSHVVKVPAAALPTIEKNGLVYSADVKVRKPGFYNFRVALRDTNSRKLGSVSQVVQVPELKPSRLFVSGLVVTQIDASGKFSPPTTPDPNNAFALPESPGVPGIRRFRRGSVIAYPYLVYNAKPSATGRPNLTVEVNLYKDGKLLVDGPATPADLQPQSDWSRISDFGYLRLNPNLSAGDYVLQVIVRDLEAGKGAVSSQWSEFQIID